MDKRQRFDVLVAGTGIAGLTCAIHCREVGLSVLVITKEDRVEESNTNYAQGGIIAWRECDSPESLARDVYEAGCRYNGREAVETFAREDAVCLEERTLVVAEHEHERPSHANTPSDDLTVTPGTSYCCCERSESTNCRAPRAERPPRRVAKRSARRSSSSWSIRMSASSASLWTMSR